MSVAAQAITVGPVKVFLGDALDLMPRLGEKADLCASDPPYRLTSGGRGEKGDGSMSGIFDAEDYDNSGCLMEMAEWNQMVPPIYRALKEDADLYLMCNDKNLLLAGGAVIGAGFKLHNVLAWDKGGPTPNRWYMKHLEFTIYAWKGRSRAIAYLGSKQMFSHPRPGLGHHPTEKPVALMRHYIENSTQPGDLVLDPFAGSGSTLVAAMLSGRRAIGIEKDPAHFQTCVLRLQKSLARCLSQEVSA